MLALIDICGVDQQQTPIIGLLAFYFLLCSPASQFGLVSLLSIVVLFSFVSGHTVFFSFLSHIVHCNSAFGPRFCANKIISYHAIVVEMNIEQMTMMIMILHKTCSNLVEVNNI